MNNLEIIISETNKTNTAAVFQKPHYIMYMKHDFYV